MNSYSVIIDSRRGYFRLARFLAAIEQNAQGFAGRLETWLVIDKPRNRMDQLAEAHGARQLLLPSQPHGKRLNIASNHSQSDVLVFIDPVIDLPPGWLDFLEQTLFHQHWDVTALVTEGWFATHWLQRLHRPGVRVPMLAMRRIWFERVGGFDPELEGGAEQDLLTRLRACHARVLQRKPWEGQRSAG
ncbi:MULTISPECIES: hypothetical protein [unclassified Modicisalibacter]|uniref:hypothetical protein n=1 Tax=unclassified Modicisalibacter TaxID=2679913 RepID=UPI001CCD1032|nr:MULTISPECIES: hypothetical protein [unclassified Modicisalibacter]MBZ9558360.1 hypothetical protein [Modicisalibacter sp. R2A 31.J]MBZ9575748.1 hypothetical protein [Modicisalibacter sp. MOD 31.J]